MESINCSVTVAVNYHRLANNKDYHLSSKLESAASLLTASTNSFRPLRSSSREKNARRHTGLVSPTCEASSTTGTTLGITMLQGKPLPQWLALTSRQAATRHTLYWAEDSLCAFNQDIGCCIIQGNTGQHKADTEISI